MDDPRIADIGTHRLTLAAAPGDRDVGPHHPFVLPVKWYRCRVLKGGMCWSRSYPHDSCMVRHDLREGDSGEE